MRLILPIVLVLLGLCGGAAGGVWWHGRDAPATHEPAGTPPATAFVEFDRRFVVPLVRGDRVHALIVTDLRLEAQEHESDHIRFLQPRLRDAFLSELYAMAVRGDFDGDLYSNALHDVLRERLGEAARGVAGEGVVGVLINELLRQDN